MFSAWGAIVGRVRDYVCDADGVRCK
jgi:hypothetical protein